MSTGPGCGTGLIVGEGGVTAWDDVLVMLGAVIILAFQAVLIHRIAGVPAPLWNYDAQRADLMNSHQLAA